MYWYYYKKYIEAEVDEKKYTALVYVKDESEPVNIASQHYIAVLWRAYKKFGFDMKILDEAKKFSSERYQRMML